MKAFFRALKLTAIFIFSAALILFFASIILQDKVAGIVLTSFNKSLSTKISTGSSRLSFLRKFPHASLQLSEVLVHSSPGFDKQSFTGINTDTLLYAEAVSVEFSIIDIIKGNYDIHGISAHNGRLNLFSDMGSFVNYTISASNGNTDNDDITINLEKISLDNIKAYYNNRSVSLIISGVIRNGRVKSLIKGKKIDFDAKGDLEIGSFSLYETIVNGPVPAKVDLDLQSSESGTLFKKSTLTIDRNDFIIDGSVSSNMMDLNVTGKKIDVSDIKKYMPLNYSSYLKEYHPGGTMAAECRINGPVTKVRNPHVEISFNMKNGIVRRAGSGIPVEGLSFTGSFSNGAQNNYNTSTLSLKDIIFRLGSSAYKGSASISNFNVPATELVAGGTVYPGDIREFFGIKSIATVSGSFNLDMKLKTRFWPRGKITLDNIIDLRPEASLLFNSFSINLADRDFHIDNVNGNLSLSNDWIARNLSFTYKDQEIKLNGTFSNLPEWLSGRKVVMKATADVIFREFIPGAFMNKQPVNVKSASRKAFRMPGDLLLDVNFSIDSLSYETFSSSKIRGSLTYKSRLLTFNSLYMHSLNGVISGNGFIAQNTNRSVILRGIFNVSDIDVNKTFKTFHNFGQDFIKAENLSGSLSGSISVMLPMDSLLNPQVKALTAEGKYILVNGALINFEPVKQLSSFIEVSELENINFDKLENDFHIKNNFLYTPQMDVKSSAADLAVNGKHSFNNDYEYHVKVLLSEILSRKRKKNRNKISEFGVVEDDGLGRTSLLLKITNDGDDVKVGYDMRAAADEVKNNIRSEKQTLKKILNEEYGWYKKDSIPVQKPAEKKQRFRVTWDDDPGTSSGPHL